MRSPLILIALLCACLFGCLTVAAPGQALERRDGSSPSSDAGNPGGAGSAASTNFPFPNLSSLSATSTSQAPSPTAQSSSSPSASGSVNQAGNITASSTGAGSPSPSAATANNNASANVALPIQPALNAVWGVAGFLLLVSGIIFTFVGIKHKQIQVFLSACYTAAIGITVLIIYIVTPPVSLGQQGAYLAAIIFPAFILGGISVVFKDVTEGLACGVGGFALAMWLLTLQPGGLLHSMSARVVFIIVFTLVIFSLSFSHHTRSYGVIGATAFAGATSLILGVDCFAGVGLKEFWPYIWNINNKLFPLGTTTYPLTKGMVAEIAAIPIATLFGILSQIKIWNILQKKRERRAEEQAERDRRRDVEESRRGKDLVHQTEAERIIWEQTYSEMPREQTGVHSDSGIGSEASASEKGSMKRWSGSGRGKMQESSIEVYEMQNLASPSNDKLVRRMTPHIVVSVADEPHDEEAGENMSSPKDASPRASSQLSQRGEEYDEEAARDVPATEQEASWMKSLRGMSLRPKTTAPPVIPLPFTVPTGNDKSVHEDDVSSVATAATSNRLSKRFSGSSLLDSLSKHRLSLHKKQPSDTSSLQAIADENFDSSSRVSAKSSLDDLSHDGKPLSTTGSKEELLPDHLLSAAKLSMAGLDSEAVAEQQQQETRRSPAPARSTSAAPESLSAEQVEDKSVGATEGAQKHLDMASLSTGVDPKTVLKYRANEWAKHLLDAEAPQEDEIPQSLPPSPATEVPPEVNAPAESLTAPTTEELPSNRSSVASSSSDNQPSDSGAPKASWPRRTSMRQSSSPLPDSKASEARPPLVRSSSSEGRVTSRMSTMRSSSNSRARTGKMRQSTQPVVTSPIQEDVEATFVSPKRTSTARERPPTLLERRESMTSPTSLSRSQSQASVHKLPITNAMYNASRNSLAQSAGRPVSQVSRRASNPEQLNFQSLQHHYSSSSLRSSNQPYSPPPPVRTYSPMPDLNSPVQVVLPALQPITHSGPVAPPDKPLHYRTHTPNTDLMTHRMAAWRTELQYDNEYRRSSTMADVDLEFGAGASSMGSQWLAQQRQSRQMEQAGRQNVGWSGNGMASPPMMSPTGYVDPVSSAMMQSQAHQSVMAKMQSKAKPK